jgi:hypothetical protein
MQQSPTAAGLPRQRVRRQRLRLFGAIAGVQATGADQKERAIAYATMAADALIPPSRTNYRRWVNFSWGVVEAGGVSVANDWTATEAARLRALVARAHQMNVWIRFYTLNGHAKEAGRGWGAFYNFGSPEAARIRWKAALEAGADFIATDQYEELARMRAEASAANSQGN